MVLHEAERARIPRTRDGFDEAARSLTRGIEGHANVIAATEFDSEAVIEDLDNTKIITPVLEQITELTRRLTDSQLVWRAEAWESPCGGRGVPPHTEGDRPSPHGGG